MGQTVYADILFLINFSMDFLCFYITFRLLHRKFAKFRAFLAAIGGGVYSCAILFSGFSPPLELVCDFFAGLLMCVAVFSSKKVKIGEFFLLSATYIGVSVALGGFMTALFNLMNTLELPLADIEGDGVPVWLFAIIAAVSGAVTLLGGKFFRKKQTQRYCDIEVTFGKKTVKLPALSDTGNLLRDPVNGKPVVLVELDTVASALPVSLVKVLNRKDPSDISELPISEAKKIRLIPAGTATGENMLIAVKPDKISVSSNGSSHEVDAIVAPVRLRGSAEGFSALIPPELIV